MRSARFLRLPAGAAEHAGSVGMPDPDDLIWCKYNGIFLL